jgi:hypothetical protein
VVSGVKKTMMLDALFCRYVQRWWVVVVEYKHVAMRLR